MILAELPNWITDAGSLAAALAAVAVVLGLITRARPVRWVWRSLVSAPMGRWFGGIVSAQVDPVRSDIAELRGDLGTNTVDLKALRVELVTHMGAEEGLRSDDIANRDRRQEEMDAWRTEVSDDIAGVRGDIRTVHGRIDDALGALAAGNHEVRQP